MDDDKFYAAYGGDMCDFVHASICKRRTCACVIASRRGDDSRNPGKYDGTGTIKYRAAREYGW